MRLDDWRRGGRETTYEGHTVFYRDDGAGDAVLCIHGFPTASFDWQRVWPGLTERFRAIAPDMLGFGFSAKPPDYPYSILDQATLHERLLAELGVERAHVLAHDYGDTVAQELLARANEGRAAFEIRSICFLNGGLFPEQHRPRLVQRLLNSPAGPLVGRLLSERSLAKSFAGIFGPDTQPSPEEISEFWSLVDHNDGSRIAHRLIRYIDERKQWRERWVGALSEARIPLRLIDGALDPISGAHMAEHYARLVPDADVVLLDRIGHYPQVEAPDRVLAEYLAFVDAVG